MNARFLPTLECLETRSTPAGLVTGSFAHGTWTLVGDAAANEILINPGPERGEFSVTGMNGTEIAGATKANRVKHIVVRLGESDDFVRVNDTGDAARLRGSLTIQGGQGANTVDIRQLDIGQHLSIRNGAGFDELSLTSSLVRGNVVVQNGTGGSLLAISRANAADSSAIRGNLQIVNGEGEDTTFIVDTSIGGNVSVANGLPDANESAGVVLILNEKNMTAQSVIGGNVAISYLGGNVGIDGIWDTEVLGNVRFNYGTANSDVYFDGYSVAQPAHIHGNLTVTGQGTQRVHVGKFLKETGLIVDGNLTIDVGDDDGSPATIEFMQLHVGGDTLIRTGSGPDTIRIDDSTFAGSTQILTGAEHDEVVIEGQSGTSFGTQFAGPLKINLGAGGDTLALGATGDETCRVELLDQAFLSGGAPNADQDVLDRGNLVPVFHQPVIESFEAIF